MSPTSTLLPSYEALTVTAEVESIHISSASADMNTRTHRRDRRVWPCAHCPLRCPSHGPSVPPCFGSANSCSSALTFRYKGTCPGYRLMLFPKRVFLTESEKCVRMDRRRRARGGWMDRTCRAQPHPGAVTAWVYRGGRLHSRLVCWVTCGPAG